jgi:hypothetical protein
MPDLPQVALPPFVYNALVCGLATAISWQVLSLLQRWRATRRRDP